jgi:hypothetical protein
VEDVCISGGVGDLGEREMLSGAVEGFEKGMFPRAERVAGITKMRWRVVPVRGGGVSSGSCEEGNLGE